MGIEAGENACFVRKNVFCLPQSGGAVNQQFVAPPGKKQLLFLLLSHLPG
jgi:hypothetical protein